MNAVLPDTRAAELIRARYRQAAVPAPATSNPALEGLLSHRSVRAFAARPVPASLVETLVAAAQSASSSSNLQPWSVVAVTDPERKARLSKLAGDQGFIREAPLFLVWLIDFNRLTQVAEGQGGAVEGLDYTESFLLGAVDTSLAAQNAFVALESLGLGAVFVGAIRNRPAEVAAELGLPPKVFALFGLAVGWPDPARPTDIKPRLPQAAVLHREQYGWGEAQTQAVAAYDPAIRSFQAEQGMTVQDWTRQAVNRTRDAAALSGRHVMKSVLRAMGFRLR
jgi:nitroreductase